MKELNLILANAPINNGNRGCVALSITSIHLIDEVLREKGISYKLYLCDSNLSSDELHFYKLTDNKSVCFYSCKYPYEFTLKGVLKGIIRYRANKNNISIFKKADYIFDIGQGDSFADIYGSDRFYQIDRIHRLARKMKKPYCILPQTIGPFRDKYIKCLAEKSILKSAMVMARDKMSYDYILQGIPQLKNIDEYIDVAFFMPYEKIRFSPNYIHVGLNVSSLLWHGGYTRNNQFELIVDYRSLIQKIIDYFLSFENVKLHLISHVVLDKYDIENDYAVSCDLYHKYHHPNLILSDFFLSPVEAKNYIAGMDFFMGARMHSTIGAFSSGVPVVPMAYSRKFNGLFIDTLSYSHMVDMKCCNMTEILDIIKESFKNRLQLKSEIDYQMQTRVVEYRKKIEESLCRFMSLK